MRALNKKTKKNDKLGCVICKRKTCIDDVPKIICRITPDSGIVTRSITRLKKSMSDFVIIEIYRCMPLLGDEDRLVPHWDVHMVHYALHYPNFSKVHYN